MKKCVIYSVSFLIGLTGGVFLEILTSSSDAPAVHYQLKHFYDQATLA